MLTFGTNWAFDNSPEEFCFTQSDNELFYCEGLEISGDLDFQEGGVGTTASKTIQIYNALTETVLISNIILPNGFISNWESGEIIPFNSQSIEITFKPKELIDYSGEIVFETDAFSENIKYPISGKGVYNIFSDTIAFKEFWGANNQDTTDTRWKSNDKIELIDFLNKDIPDIGVGIENERISSLSIQVEQDFRQISTIPESFQNISNLKFLELETNLLEELPDSFGNLDNLEHLNLDGNKFVQFPSAITKLDKLETLTLNFNGIESIPKEINNMTSLINLSISGSNIKELPSEIGELVNLETFALGSSLLETFPLDLLNLINLKSLSLSGNNIEVLPNEISRLSNLISFGLNDNNLVEIPEGLFELRNLKSLYVQDNQLNFIPETDSKLVNLESLYLDGNKLVRLPESIGVSNQLRTLWLHNNLLVGLPNSIGNLNKVQNLELIIIDFKNFHQLFLG